VPKRGKGILYEILPGRRPSARARENTFEPAVAARDPEPPSTAARAEAPVTR
jgi:hypothetical protein